MSSLKMTFSLASLVLILGLVFAIAPAMAQVVTVTDSDVVSADVADSTRTIDRTLVFRNDTDCRNSCWWLSDYPQRSP